jgi:cation diffusion facilitator family transporter
MKDHSVAQWRHDHDFHIDSTRAERRTRWVVALTAATMGVEITAGYLFGSMALLADGWHMGTHVAALGISLFAYRYARRHADTARFSFGTGKVGALGGFASAVALAVVALLMGMESVERLIAPQPIRFNEAILVASLGLMVNLLSAALLHGAHGHAHNHGHDHGHHDHNLRAAYLHVVADALTSLLAIVALITGKYFGWIWMDAAMGLVGAALITRWGYGLVKETSGVLLDSTPDSATLDDVRRRVEADADNRLSDLHLWRLGPRDCAAIVAIVTHHPRPPAHYKALLEGVPGLVHVTVEVNKCADPTCTGP